MDKTCQLLKALTGVDGKVVCVHNCSPDVQMQSGEEIADKVHVSHKSNLEITQAFYI